MKGSKQRFIALLKVGLLFLVVLSLVQCQPEPPDPTLIPPQVTETPDPIPASVADRNCSPLPPTAVTTASRIRPGQFYVEDQVILTGTEEDIAQVLQELGERNLPLGEPVASVDLSYLRDLDEHLLGQFRERDLGGSSSAPIERFLEKGLSNLKLDL